MASTCRKGRVTGLGGWVGAEILQTTVPRNSRFCSHILLRTLAFLSEYGAHWQKSFYMQLEEMINGDHKTPGRWGNYLNCGISWLLSASRGKGEPSPSWSLSGVFINEPFQEFAAHPPASLSTL